MSRALIIVRSDADRVRAASWCRKAPDGTRVEFKQEKRSSEQNDKLWATLSDVAAQKEHYGRKYSPDVWKVLFMHAWGSEVQLVPALVGGGIVPLTRSSDLSKQEMAELIEFILAYGAQNGVVFHDEKASAA